MPPKAVRRSETWGIVIAAFEDGVPTKAGDYDDVVLVDSSQRHDTNAVIKAVCSASNNDDFLFPTLSYRSYCEHIAKASLQVGLGELHLTPHVLRHSGASHDAYYRLRDFQAIQERGRCKATRSVLRCKKPGRMLLLLGPRGSSLGVRGQKYAPDLGHLFH